MPAVHGIDRNAVAEELAFAATGSLTANAVVTFLTGGIEGNNNLVADIEVCDSVALFNNFANEFMAADEVGRAFQMTTVEVKVAAAECGAGDFEDGVCRFL